MLKINHSNKLFVATVYTESKLNNLWYDLQIKFLESTTDEYDFGIYSSGADISLFKSNHLIKHVEKREKFEHCKGLNFLLNYAIKKKYKSILFLDSDCFPILSKWQEKIEDEMIGFNVASVIRPENLDLFPHPCACYIKNINNSMKFIHKKKVNLIGVEFNDLEFNENKFYPLLRSNAVNLDPILCGIYKNFFYHHGAGSRKIGKKYNEGRCRGYFYGKTDMDSTSNYAIQRLQSDPELFIEYLNKYKFFAS
jgi:hypothetical protein